MKMLGTPHTSGLGTRDGPEGSRERNATNPTTAVLPTGSGRRQDLTRGLVLWHKQDFDSSERSTNHRAGIVNQDSEVLLTGTGGSARAIA